MTFPTQTAKNAAGEVVTLNTLPTSGRKARADALGVTFSPEDDVATETTNAAVLAAISALRADLTATPVALGYRQITTLTAATGLGTIPTGAKSVLIAVSGAPIRYRDDGTDPTAAFGQPFAIGDSFTYESTLSAFRVIQQSPGAVLDVTFYG